AATGAPGTPEWLHPSRARDAYALGQRDVFEGHDDESDHEDANTCAPAEYPPARHLITADEDEHDPVDGQPPQRPDWAPSCDNLTGDTFQYEGTPYRVRQNHTSQPTWLPSSVPALYEPGTITGGE